MKTVREFLFFSLIALFCFSSNGQSDSIKKHSKKISILVGSCATLKLYKTGNDYLPPATPQESIPNTYYGLTFSLYFSNFKKKHYLFQTGLEYAYAKYYVANYSEESSKYSEQYYAMKFVVHTITIPVYFNLLLIKQKLYFGIGPNLDVCPYTTGSGYKNVYPQIKIDNQRFYSRLVNVGAAAKIGLNFKIGKGLLTIESRLKSGIASVFSGGTLLVNEYCSLLVGYTF